MEKREVRIRIINQAREIQAEVTRERAEAFKKGIRDFLRNPEDVIYEMQLDTLILVPKGFINNSYIVYEEMKETNLKNVASLL